MIKLDQLSTSVSLSRSASRASSRQRIKNVFDASPEDLSTPDGVELEKTMAIDSPSLIHRLSLLNLQLVTPQERKAIEYGESLLNVLQKLQEQILLGELSYNDLKHLENELKNGTLLDIESDDLSTIISDIQVRVAVELAKHTK